MQSIAHSHHSFACLLFRSFRCDHLLARITHLLACSSARSDVINCSFASHICLLALPFVPMRSIARSQHSFACLLFQSFPCNQLLARITHLLAARVNPSHSSKYLTCYTQSLSFLRLLGKSNMNVLKS